MTCTGDCTVRQPHSGDQLSADDHGDEVETASAIRSGGVAPGGTLDYMFDFDFFRFHAEEGQRYRMNVNHEVTGKVPASVTLYAPTG